MTYTKDRTLLASLAFADKDKKDVRHDLACQYLLQPEVAEKISKLFKENEGLEEKHPIKFIGGDLEIPLTKGQDQYKTFIGFIDGALSFTSGSQECQIFFEVKINPETTGNVLRQLNLYKQFMHSNEYFYSRVELLVTAYDVSPADQALFDQNGITCVRLGEAFDEFVRAQEVASKTRNDKIVVI